MNVNPPNPRPRFRLSSCFRGGLRACEQLSLRFSAFSENHKGCVIPAQGTFQKYPCITIDREWARAGLQDYHTNSGLVQTSVPQRGNTTKPKAGRAPTGPACLG
jgi:hypothetical protein